MEANIYVVTMHSWGNSEGYSYVCGAFDTFEKAENAGKQEKRDRGNKYEFNISTVVLNERGVKKFRCNCENKRVTIWRYIQNLFWIK